MTLQNNHYEVIEVPHLLNPLQSYNVFELVDAEPTVNFFISSFGDQRLVCQ